MKNLRQLYLDHEGKLSDKWDLYLSEYDRLFTPYRDGDINLLEIGVQNGGSLDIWAKYFRNAKHLVGCDINTDCKNLHYDDSRVNIVVGDANTQATEQEIVSITGRFDLIIDDGSHTSGDIIESFTRYFPYLNDTGLFIAEDMHCSYWQTFDGGLYDPHSSISFFKALTDIINYEHWGIEGSPQLVLDGFTKKYSVTLAPTILETIHSIEFINSLCIIRKKDREKNRLGPRVIAGQDEAVVEGHVPYRGSMSVALDQTSNPWSACHFHPMIELEVSNAKLSQFREQVSDLERQLNTLKDDLADFRESSVKLNTENEAMSQEIALLTQRNSGLQTEIGQLYNSKSWRLTAPIRWAVNKLRPMAQLARLPVQVMSAHGGLILTIKKIYRIYKTNGLIGIGERFRATRAANVPRPTSASGEFDRNDYTEWVRRYDTFDEPRRESIRRAISAMWHPPKISIVMPTFNSRPEWLIEAIESVLKQIYPYWELCIADDASTNKATRDILERYASEDSRIKVIFRENNGHISAASNSALELVTSEWTTLLDHDDLLAENALFMVADTILKNPNARLIYSDEDKITKTGHRFSPYFKCNWNLSLFYSHNLISHLGVYKTDILKAIGGFRIGFEGAQDHDLALRYIERISQTQIHHIPHILYHWRAHANSTASSIDTKSYATVSGEKALNEHFHRQKIKAKASFAGCGYRVSYELPPTPPLVTLIIPTRNGIELIRQCVESILSQTDYLNYEIMIVDNGSDDPLTLRYFEEIKTNPRVVIRHDDSPFNYSALNNTAVNAARGEIIGLLNNDIEVISPGWLTEMVALACQPGVGAVGARLWYPNDTLQHGGVILGLGGVAGHAHKHLPRGLNGYINRAQVIQELSAVTAACLVIRKSTYEKVGGLNAADLKVAFNDVDFCLRVREAGYRNIWTPYAELYHHESATRGLENTPEKQARFMQEVLYLKERWGDALLEDYAYSPNLTLDHEDFSLAWPPRVTLPESIFCHDRYNQATS